MKALDKNLPCFVFSFYIDSPIAYLNEVMMETLGYGPSEVIGKLKFENLLTVGSRIFYKTHFFPTLMMEKQVSEILLSFLSREGEEYPFLINMSLTEKERGQEVTGVGIRMVKRYNYERGIIEAKQAVEKALKENAILIQAQTELETSRTLLEQQLNTLARINEEQNELSKILAHDLQEPLRKILMFISRLEESSSFTDRSRVYLEKLFQITERNHTLIKRLQVYHALDNSPIDPRAADLKTLIEAAFTHIDITSTKMDYSQLKVRELYGDVPKLTLLFSELLKNSYQYRSPKRPLEIKISSSLVKENYYRTLSGAYRYMDFLRIRISDNSLGFPTYGKEIIFKPLQQLNKDHGKGLGLAYCKKIVELHGGRIAMRPVTGGGSECTILLPQKSTDNDQTIIKP